MPDPAEKYRDKVDPRHQMAMDAIGFCYRAMEPHREQFEVLIEAERESHSIGHIVDPTLYRDMITSKSFARQLRLVRAALAFMNEARAVADELKKEAGESSNE